MTVHHRYPEAPLSEYVEVLWLGGGGLPTHPFERVLPTGSMGIIVGLNTDQLTVIDRVDHSRADGYGASMMIGAHARHFVIDAADQATVLGVHFKPGGARPFLECPADELFDLNISLDSIWGGDAARFRGRLLEFDSPRTMLAEVERLLTARLRRVRSQNRAIAFAIAALTSQFPQPTTRALADRIGWSQRRFIQIFREEVGFTPKVFGRIQRFQRAIDCVESNPAAVNWAGVAACCGYYDQSHLIHDFRDFVDLSPTAYLRQRGPHRNHVPILSQIAVA
jgi:AraC-like DNA-binding protein